MNDINNEFAYYGKLNTGDQVHIIGSKWVNDGTYAVIVKPRSDHANVIVNRYFIEADCIHSLQTMADPLFTLEEITEFS